VAASVGPPTCDLKGHRCYETECDSVRVSGFAWMSSDSVLSAEDDRASSTKEIRGGARVCVASKERCAPIWGVWRERGHAWQG
jgi:hypothetical protein